MPPPGAAGRGGRWCSALQPVPPALPSARGGGQGKAVLQTPGALQDLAGAGRRLLARRDARQGDGGLCHRYTCRRGGAAARPSSASG